MCILLWEKIGVWFDFDIFFFHIEMNAFVIRRSCPNYWVWDEKLYPFRIRMDKSTHDENIIYKME